MAQDTTSILPPPPPRATIYQLELYNKMLETMRSLSDGLAERRISLSPTDDKEPTPCHATWLHDISPHVIKTQKAKGVIALAQGINEVAPAVRTPPKSQRHNHAYENTRSLMFVLPWSCPPDAHWKDFPPMFARPCPEIPRHGFVESRPVANLEELENVFREARAADPNAEVILMPKLTGAFSAVATNAGVTWGLGNAGVTSNESATFHIPVLANKTTWHKRIAKGNQKLIRVVDALIGVAYVELVEHQGQIFAVQLRDGPEPPVTTEYIPRQTKVKNVIRTTGYPDLLSWEKTLNGVMKISGNAGGTVIHIPNGALSSHYAVHGIQLGIPVLTRAHVSIGDTLDPPRVKTPSLTKRDLQYLAKLIKGYYRQDLVAVHKGPNGKYFHIHASTEATATIAASIHAMSGWDNSEHLMRLRAIAMVLLPRYILAATMGEVRHWKFRGPGRLKGMRRRATKSYPTKDFSSTQDARARIYKAGLSPRHTIGQQLRHFTNLDKDFSMRGWSGEMDDYRRGAHFGGYKWAMVARSGFRMTAALQKFMEKPTHYRWKHLVLAANVALHTVHNNGHAFNKWISSYWLDQIAKVPTLGFMNAFAGRVVLGLPIKANDDPKGYEPGELGDGI